MPTPWQIECLLARIQSLRLEIDRVKQKDHPYPEPDTIYNALLSVIDSCEEYFVEAHARYGLDEKGRRKLQTAFDSTEQQLKLIFEFFSRVERVDSPRIPFEILRALSWVSNCLLNETTQAAVRLDPKYTYSISSCRQEFEGNGWQNSWPRENKDENVPSTVLLIGFPSTEASSILVHALAAHEFGHQFCERLKSRIKLVREEVVTRTKKQHSQDILDYQQKMKERGFAGSDDAATRRIISTIDTLAKNWLNEIFSDLVATRLVGPAFLAAFDRILLGDSKNSSSHPNGRLRRSLVETYLRDKLPHIVQDPIWSSLFAETQTPRSDASSDLLMALGEEICSASLAPLSDIVEQVPSPLLISDIDEQGPSPLPSSKELTELIEQMELHIENLSPPSHQLEISGMEKDADMFWLIMYVAWHFRLNKKRFSEFTNHYGWRDDQESSANKKAEDALGNLVLHALQSIELRFRWEEKIRSSKGENHDS